MESKQSKANSRLDAGGCTDPGRRYGGLNQDTWLAHQLEPEGQRWVFAVFDGHALLGELAANIASKVIIDAFSGPSPKFTVGSFRQQPIESMKSLFFLVHQCIISAYDTAPDTIEYGPYGKFRCVDRSDMSIYRSVFYGDRELEFGCTGAVAVVLDDLLVIGNAGDSEIIFSELQDGEDNILGEAVLMTETHRGTNPTEIARMKAVGNVYIEYDGYVCPAHPRWKSHHLSITRSLGHKHLHQFGIIAEPYVRVHQCSGSFGLVLVSDGVTDHVYPQDVMDIVA
eukprot:Ihof_evm1s1200 gene=Ihof_evmTU1s1200